MWCKSCHHGREGKMETRGDGRGEIDYYEEKYGSGNIETGDGKGKKNYGIWKRLEERAKCLIKDGAGAGR